MIEDPLHSSELDQKRRDLDRRLVALSRVMVAYSGGIDSAFLAFAAHRALGDNMLAVIADSPSLTRSHLKDAVGFAGEHGIPLQVVRTAEMANPDYTRNDAQRCFHCKDELFGVMEKFGVPFGFSRVAYGMNLDDIGEFRPGQTAAKRRNVLAPLADSGLGKAEIRALALREGLRVWNKPASACLSSRIAYGLPVTAETLSTIEAGEEALRSLGLRQFRLRHHGDLARIEIDRQEMETMLTLPMLDQARLALRSLGYKYVTLDLDGYRSGSMNALLNISDITRATEDGEVVR